MNQLEKLHLAVAKSLADVLRRLESTLQYLFGLCVSMFKILMLLLPFVYLGAYALEVRRLGVDWISWLGIVVAVGVGCLLALVLVFVIDSMISTESTDRMLSHRNLWVVGLLISLVGTFGTFSLFDFITPPLSQIHRCFYDGLSYLAKVRLPLYRGECAELMEAASRSDAYERWHRSYADGVHAADGDHISLWVDDIRVTNRGVLLNLAAKTWFDTEMGHVGYAAGAFLVDAKGAKYDVVCDTGEFNPFSGARELKGQEIYRHDVLFEAIPRSMGEITLHYPGFKPLRITVGQQR